ncbi:MAG: hypothetical protein MUF62_01155 [Chitinophagaceae bacterium]|jgi:hypothetical protein|nr:hypothetical protein [Chitinophagaceae bacterium]
MRKLYLLLYAAALATVAHSQTMNVRQDNRPRLRHDERYDKPYQANQLKLRWQPLGLLNVFDMNLTGGLEYVYRQRRAVFADLGYVFASTMGQQNDGGITSARGIIGRAGHRFYFGRRPAAFVDTDLTYKGVRYDDGEQWIGRGVVNGVPAYEELMQVYSRKQVWTAEAKIGLVYSVHPQGKTTIENWLGLGIRWRNHLPLLPPDAQVPITTNWLLFDFDYSRLVIPQLSLGFRLTFDVGAARKASAEAP